MLKTMDPELIRQLIKNEEDILTPEIEAEKRFYQYTQCPMCGQNGCEKRVREAKVVLDENGHPTVVSSPFGDGLLTEGYAHCIHCNTNFNPHTGMIFKTEASIIKSVEFKP